MWLDDGMEGWPAPWKCPGPGPSVTGLQGIFRPAPLNRLAGEDGESGKWRVLPR